MIEWERTIYFDARKDFMNEIARRVESRKAIDRIDEDLEEYEDDTDLVVEYEIDDDGKIKSAPPTIYTIPVVFEFEDEDLQF